MSDRLPEAPALEPDDPMPYPAAPARVAPLPRGLGDVLAAWGAAALALARRPRVPAAWIELSPRDESRLFTFARRVAIEVRAPAVDRVFVAPDVLIAAGATSLVGRGGRCLVVGLGLLHALGLTEFKTLLAQALLRAAPRAAAVARWAAAQEGRAHDGDEAVARAALRWRAAMDALDDARDDGALSDDLYAHLARGDADADARPAWALLRNAGATRLRVTAAFHAARGDSAALTPAAHVERALAREREGEDRDPRWHGAFALRVVDPGEVDALLARAVDDAQHDALVRGAALDDALRARAPDLDARIAETEFAMALALGGDVAEASARRWRAQHALAAVASSLDALCDALARGAVTSPDAARQALDAAAVRARASVIAGALGARELDPEGARARPGADLAGLHAVACAMRRRAKRLARKNLCAILGARGALEARWRAEGCPRPRPPSLAVPDDLR